MPQAPIKIPMRINQGFGANPAYYKKYGMKGHNGIDINAPTGTKFFAILPGVWHLLSQQTIKNGKAIWIGYGAAWRLYVGTGKDTGQEWTFGHLQNRMKTRDGQNLAEGIQMGETDNTGDSTGPHLHITVKIIVKGVVQNQGNGFGGAVDPLPIMKKLGMQFTNA